VTHGSRTGYDPAPAILEELLDDGCDDQHRADGGAVSGSTTRRLPIDPAGCVTALGAAMREPEPPHDARTDPRYDRFIAVAAWDA
jgi:hypothetical protein